jgi:hypothetical protein
MRVVLTAATVLLVAGCATTFERQPASPELQLLSSAALALPAGCEPISGEVYRTRYLVQTDGGVTDADAESGSGCVQDALRRWVESFRYAPVAGPVATTIDWMAVTATRGG